MPRKSTGTVRILRSDQGELQWHAKWTRADGSRTPWLPIPGSDEPPIDLDDFKGAKANAESNAAEIRTASAAIEGRGRVETVERYAKRWTEWRQGRGLGNVSCRSDQAIRNLERESVVGFTLFPTFGE